MIFRAVMALGVSMASPRLFLFVFNKRRKTKSQNALSTCPGSHSWVAESLEPRSPECQVISLSLVCFLHVLSQGNRAWERMAFFFR